MIILIGPSASGKTTIGKYLEKLGIKKIVTYTTREKRINEIDGVDYHFITKEEFSLKAEEGFFIEYACYSNNCYGTAKKSLKEDGYLIIEPQGFLTYSNVVSFYIDLDREERRKRMLIRKDSLKNIEERLLNDDKCFTKEIKEKATYILDGRLEPKENAEFIYEVVNGL